jgi:molecular chaperone GrpE
MPEPEIRDPVTNSTAGAADPEAQPGDPGAEPAKTGEPAAGPESAQPEGNERAEIGGQLAAAKAEAAANYDRFMRAAADLENFRRRMVREKDELRATATGRVLEDIFPVLDSLGFAVAAAKQPGADVNSLIGGVEMVLTQLKGALGAHGLKEISPLGQRFDPHQHEAISHQPSEEVAEEHVSAVVRTGYSLNGRLLRPASVVVSSGPGEESKG